MEEFSRQLWLLTRKNLILTMRSKVWTLFELILPILIILPLAVLSAKKAKVELSPGQSFDAVPLNGDVSDVRRKIGSITSIHTRWCNRRLVFVAYYAYEGLNEADNLMNELGHRFSDSAVNVRVLKMKDEDSLLNKLRTDALNNASFVCAKNRFVGGVIFDRLSMSQKKLHYRIFLPTQTTDDIWHLDKEWDDPFVANFDYDNIPESPPYWSSAFLSLQYAIDRIFIDSIPTPFFALTYNGGKVILRRLPEAAHNVNGVAAFLRVLTIFGACLHVF